MRPDQTPRQPDEGPQPLSLIVPIYNKTEVDLMGALEFVIEGFAGPPLIGAAPMPTPPGISRAVDWLHAKYGTRVPPNAAVSGFSPLDRVVIRQ